MVAEGSVAGPEGASEVGGVGGNRMGAGVEGWGEGGANVVALGPVQALVVALGHGCLGGVRPAVTAEEPPVRRPESSIRTWYW